MQLHRGSTVKQGQRRSCDTVEAVMRQRLEHNGGYGRAGAATEWGQQQGGAGAATEWGQQQGGAGAATEWGQQQGGAGAASEWGQQHCGGGGT